MMQSPSRFLAELPAEVIEEVRSRSPRVTPSGYRQSERPMYPARKAPAAPAAPPPARRPTPSARNTLPGGLQLGQRVVHPKFGEGVILDHEGEGSQARVHVNFRSAGSKWLVMAYARLEAI